MIPVILAVPVLTIVLITQMTVVNRLPLLYGSADLVLLTLLCWTLHERVRAAWAWALIAGVAVSLISALPLYLPIIIYLTATAIARLLQRRVWQTPILALLVAVVASTLVQHVLSIVVLQITGRSLSWQDGLSLITLPSMLLNLFFALPVNIFVTDMANWLYPPVE